MSVPDTQTYINQTIPKALADLNQSHVNIEQIAQYCKSVYSQPEQDKTAVFLKTQTYLKDALSNVAYHIHTVGLHFTNFLQMQANEIDRLDLQLKTIGDKMNLAHDNVGKSAFRTVESTKTFEPRAKMQKIQDENELPANARPIPKYVRQPINLKALDNVGIDLSGHKGTESFSATVESHPIQAPPPSLASPPPLSQPAVFVPAPQGPPPPPPPIGLAPPPSFMPPPPMMGLDDAPPPPPMEDLPPPFLDDMPPPPPVMDDDMMAPPPPPPL